MRRSLLILPFLLYLAACEGEAVDPIVSRP